MSELRKNKLTEEWVLYAENRQKRPYEFVKKMDYKQTGKEHCPFCKGNEQQTTSPVFQDRKENWSIRAFPNRFPAVTEKEETLHKESFYENKSAVGRHEVVVDTPNHDQTIEQFSVQHLKNVLLTLQKRFLSMIKQQNIKQVQIFKNAGADAGMSIKHSHWQLIGLPTVSKRQQEYETTAEQYYGQTHKCVVCDMIAWEKQQQKRVCKQTEHFIAIAPYASRFSYEVWIVPNKHTPSFANVEESLFEELAKLLKEILCDITELREDMSYNICFIESGKQAQKQQPESSHWMIQILPRIGGFAGFEFATETYINSVLPETAAKWYQKREKQ